MSKNLDADSHILKMSRRDIKRIKNKCKLWCKLNGIKFGSRYILDADGHIIKLTYDKACIACRAKNDGMCIGQNKETGNGPLLVLDVKSMRLYINVPFIKINKRSLNNKNFWCVEWVNHV